MEKFKSHIKNILHKDILHLLRFIRKIPSLYNQDKLIQNHYKNNYSHNRLFVQDNKEIYSIFCPDAINPEIEPIKKGILNTGYLRTYNIFIHQCSAWVYA